MPHTITAQHVHKLLATAYSEKYHPALIRDWITGELWVDNCAPMPGATLEVVLHRADIAHWLDVYDVHWDAYPPWCQNVPDPDLDRLIDYGLDPWVECEGWVEQDHAEQVADEMSTILLTPPVPPTPAELTMLLQTTGPR